MPWKSHLGNCCSEVKNRPLLFLLHKKTAGMVRLHRITQSFSSLKWESAWKKSQLSAERNSTDWWFLPYCNVRQAKKYIYIVPEWFPWLDLQTWDSEIRRLDTLPAPENWERKEGRPGDADGLGPGLHSLPRLLHVLSSAWWDLPSFLQI